MITGDGRKKFDAFFRTLISGTNKEYPKPKSSKLTKVSKALVDVAGRDDDFSVTRATSFPSAVQSMTSFFKNLPMVGGPNGRVS